MPFAQRLGDALRRLREERRWTLEYVAEVCGTSAANVSKIEHGRTREFNLDLLDRLASAFGLRLHELFALAQGVPVSGAAALMPDELELLESYRALPAGQRDTLRTVARTLRPPGA